MWQAAVGQNAHIAARSGDDGKRIVTDVDSKALPTGAIACIAGHAVVGKRGIVADRPAVCVGNAVAAGIYRCALCYAMRGCRRCAFPKLIMGAEHDIVLDVGL